MQTLEPNSNCEQDIQDLFAPAARELGAFMNAVSELFGTEQARLAAEDWLAELESSNVLSGFNSTAGRCITITAATRLAARLNANATNTKVSVIPSSNCSI